MTLYKQKSPRYPHRPPKPLGPMIVDGRDLGHAMRPHDIFIRIRFLYDDDETILAIFLAAVNRLEKDLAVPPEDRTPALFELPLEERMRALEETREISMSRIKAWRKRAREMTWRELRMFFLGICEIQ